MELAKYISDDGFCYNDIFYKTSEDLIISGILGFCGCGQPTECLKYILKVLTHIDDSINKAMSIEEFHKKRIDIFKDNEGSMYFIFYVLDKEEFTEHGGSVPGWLTEKGKHLKKLIEEHFQKENE